MTGVETIARIRFEHYQKGKGIKRIGRELPHRFRDQRLAPKQKRICAVLLRRLGREIRHVLHLEINFRTWLTSSGCAASHLSNAVFAEATS
jgi:hypothetical protein